MAEIVYSSSTQTRNT